MSVRDIERASILAFVEKYKHLLDGRVLDFGCGTQPYRHFVQGQYLGYDKNFEFGCWDLNWQGLWWDTILCTQVMEYIQDPLGLLKAFHVCLRPGGHLVMTYPTNWDEVEGSDLFRFTRNGMELLLGQAGFQIQEHEKRADVYTTDGFRFPLGYGVVATK